MQRKASAVWSGDLKSGKGSISTDSGVLKQTQYSFSTRFENGVGTNPEELLAAAHAGCFTMALSAQLGAAGLTSQSLLVDFQHNKVVIAGRVGASIRSQAMRVHAVRLADGLMTINTLVKGVRCRAVIDTSEWVRSACHVPAT